MMIFNIFRLNADGQQSMKPINMFLATENIVTHQLVKMKMELGYILTQQYWLQIILQLLWTKKLVRSPMMENWMKSASLELRKVA